MKGKIIFAGIITALTLGTTVFASNSIGLFVNGKSVQSSVEPQIINGTTMVPIRTVSEALGAKVDWNGDNNSISISLPTASTSSNGINRQDFNELVSLIDVKSMIAWAGDQSTLLMAILNILNSDSSSFMKQQYKDQLNRVQTVSMSNWQTDINSYNMSEDEKNQIKDMMEHLKRCAGYLESGMYQAAQEEWMTAKKYNNDLYNKYDTLERQKLNLMSAQ